jgi:hypothetical protein
MRVRATQDGFIYNVYITAGTVFDLINNPDGSIPEREEAIPVMETVTDAKTGKKILRDTGEVDYQVLKDEEGNLVHRDLALDMGDQMMRRGPKRGEAVRFGWMEIVPDSTPLTKVMQPGFDEPVELDLRPYQYGFDAKTRRLRMPPLPKAPKAPQAAGKGTASNPKAA